MNSSLSQTVLDPLLGRYEKTAKDGVSHTWEMYYEKGEGEKAIFCLRWGRVGAKKLQTRPLQTIEAYYMFNKMRNEGYKLVDNTFKHWSDVQRETLSAAVSAAQHQTSKPRKM